MKRLFDLLVTSILLIILFPVMIMISIIIKRKLGSPVIYKQKRPGLNNKPFYILKFRTMTDTVDDNGNLLPDISRLTPLGKVLRRFSLDEIPQLINVLKGEMSLVGPRPLLMEYLDRYTPEQARRHHVKPGMTGWAQVNGRNALTWEDKFTLDIWYVDHRSFILDMKILWMTFLKVLKREGINQAEHVTMPEFKGSEKEC